MIYLVDSDVGLTLCECDLIQYLPKALGCSWADIRFNTEFRRVIRKPHTSLNMTPTGLARAVNFAKICNYVNDNDVNVNDFVIAIDAGANAGEAELVAAIDRFFPDEVTVITGDRAALVPLFRDVPNCDMKLRYMGNIMTIDQLLLRMNTTLGYATLAPNLVLGLARLSFLKPYFKLTPLSEAALVASLNARLTSDRGACPGLLCP